MNNKELGNSFENEMVELLAKKEWWAHFITPDRRGAQPFDIIAVRDGIPIAIDCKTSKDHIFRISRLEDNQVLGFTKWLACGNTMAYIAVLHDECVYLIYYKQLEKEGKVDLKKMEAWEHGVSL